MRPVPSPVRHEPGTLITGSGRCGTGWIATVLTTAGFTCGHERWWTVGERDHGLDGDASWLGCFDDGYPGRVFAQVRDPAVCIPSIYANEHAHPWLLLRAQNVDLTGDWPHDAVRIWTAYTAHAVERAEAWWRVEDVDPHTLARLFGLDAADVEQAMGKTPRTTNHRPPASWTWPDGPDVDDARELAESLGYRVDW